MVCVAGKKPMARVASWGRRSASPPPGQLAEREEDYTDLRRRPRRETRLVIEVTGPCSVKDGGTGGGTLLRLAPIGRYGMCAKSPKSVTSGVFWIEANPASNLRVGGSNPSRRASTYDDAPSPYSHDVQPRYQVQP